MIVTPMQYTMYEAPLIHSPLAFGISITHPAFFLLLPVRELLYLIHSHTYGIVIYFTSTSYFILYKLGNVLIQFEFRHD